MSLEWVYAGIAMWVMVFLASARPGKREPLAKVPRAYSSYAEWRQAVMNPETPVDEVVARTPESFFEKHSKPASPATGFCKGFSSPTGSQVVPGYGGVQGMVGVHGNTNPGRPDGFVYDVNQSRSRVFRITSEKPYEELVGNFTGSFSDDDIYMVHGFGSYRIETMLPGYSIPSEVSFRVIAEAYATSRATQMNPYIAPISAVAVMLYYARI